MKTSPLLHIVRLAKRLNAADAAQTKSSFTEMVKEMKEQVDGAYKLVLLAGILPTAAYLLVSIQFYPPGVTLGDSFFFLMMGLAFGLAYGLFLFMAIVVALLLEALYGGVGHGWKYVGRGVVTFVFLVLLAVLAMLFPMEQWTMLVTAIAGFGFSGYLIALLKPGLQGFGSAPTAAPTPRFDRSTAMVIWIVALSAPLLLSSVFVRSINENVAMTAVGLRSMGVTLKLSEENYDILSSAAGGQYLAALGCNTASGKPERLVHGVNLLWHGLGERSLVEIRSAPEPRLVVELKREGVFSFRNYQGVIERCLELSGDALFKAGSSILAFDSGEDLAQMIKVIEAGKSTIKEIQVIGHADAFGYRGGAELNNKLALDRAEEIKNHIVEFADFKAVTAEGHGAREPKTLCKDWPVKATLSECLAVNRRVEVRMKFLSEKEIEQRIKERQQREAGARKGSCRPRPANAKT